jgi:hypothetical protein
MTVSSQVHDVQSKENNQVLMRIVCEEVSHYICHMETYMAERMIEDIIQSLLDRNKGQNHHIHHDNFYNSGIG